jgi:hypothetical protein
MRHCYRWDLCTTGCYADVNKADNADNGLVRRKGTLPSPVDLRRSTKGGVYRP